MLSTKRVCEYAIGCFVIDLSACFVFAESVVALRAIDGGVCDVV